MAQACNDSIWNRKIDPSGALIFCQAGLFLATLLTFGPALSRYRESDDYRIVGKVDLPAALQYFHRSAGFGRNELRPIVLLTYAWDNWLWGQNAYGYHLTNLLLHAACGALLLLVVLRLTGSLLVAFAAATLFAVNPTHHAQVAWIAARDSVVCLLFLLLAWLAHLRARPPAPERLSDSGLPKGTRSRGLWYGLSAAAFLLALGSYEGAVAFPFVLIAMELLLGRGRGPSERLLGALRATGPLLLVLAGYLTIWLILFHGSVGGYDLDLTIGGMARDFYRMHYRLFHGIQHWLGPFYLLAAWLVWRHRGSQWRLIAASLAILWLGHLPFFPVNGYADRFGFLSSIGVSLFLALSLGETQPQGSAGWQAQKIVPAFLLLLLVGYFTNSTERRLGEWREAGQLADSLMIDLKALHPSFPPDATLAFDQIPGMYRSAYLFPTGLRAAVHEQYHRDFSSILVSSSKMEPDALAGLKRQKHWFHFRYQPESRRLKEIH